MSLHGDCYAPDKRVRARGATTAAHWGAADGQVKRDRCNTNRASARQGRGLETLAVVTMMACGGPSSAVWLSLIRTATRIRHGGRQLCRLEHQTLPNNSPGRRRFEVARYFLATPPIAGNEGTISVLFLSATRSLLYKLHSAVCKPQTSNARPSLRQILRMIFSLASPI